MSSTILLVQSDSKVQAELKKGLELKSWPVVTLGTVAGVRRYLEGWEPAVVVTDFHLSDGTALEILALVNSSRRFCRVLITDNGVQPEMAFQCAQNGATGFVTGPVSSRRVNAAVEKMLARFGSMDRTQENPFLGTSRVIRDIERLALNYVRSDLPVLIEGSTGSGKGVLTRWLQRNGPRGGFPFTELNCAAIGAELLESELFGHERGAFTGATERKKGLFEVAHKGTLFLDEIGDMAINTQCKILKAVEEKKFRRLGGVSEIPVDVRIISATNKRLMAQIRKGSFREDLFHRIATLRLRLPDLRERIEDIPDLAQDLLRTMSPHSAVEVSAGAFDKLISHRWPGNIRELRNVLECALLTINGSGRLRAEDIQFLDEMPSSMNGDEIVPMREAQDRLVEVTLKRVNGDKRAAARLLKISPTTLYKRLRTLDRENAPCLTAVAEGIGD